MKLRKGNSCATSETHWLFTTCNWSNKTNFLSPNAHMACGLVEEIDYNVRILIVDCINGLVMTKEIFFSFFFLL